MSFSGDIGRFTVKLKTRNRLIYDGARAAVLAGVKFGDPRTGAPGQPVESGELRDSIKDIPESEWVSVIQPTGEAVKWASQNEDGIARPGGGPYRLLSKKGGRWSFALTRAGFPKVVEDIAQKLGGQ